MAEEYGYFVVLNKIKKKKAELIMVTVEVLVVVVRRKIGECGRVMVFSGRK